MKIDGEFSKQHSVERSLLNALNGIQMSVIKNDEKWKQSKVFQSNFEALTPETLEIYDIRL